MNTCVADSTVIINVQGIRTVTWGRTRTTPFMEDPRKPFILIVSYKGQQYSYYYETEEQAFGMYEKIRNAMVKETK